VEWAHAIAPEATVVLVEAVSACLPDLLSAVGAAADAATGASVVSMSWGVPELDPNTGLCRTQGFSAANVSFVAASGDSGHPTLWPAISPDVTAVGATKLNTNSKGDYSSEISSAFGGGGLSQCFDQPSYQSGFIPGNLKRGAPDVSLNAESVAIYSSAVGGWAQVNGTSAEAPQWGALIAIANSLRVKAGKLPLTGSTPANPATGTNSVLYGAAAGGSYLANFNDITSGPMNGKCGPVCKPGLGYDYLTGLGTPKANTLIPVLVAAP
jgi:subtilase family serine protease